jgi:hypothetical protein
MPLEAFELFRQVIAFVHTASASVADGPAHAACHTWRNPSYYRLYELAGPDLKVEFLQKVYIENVLHHR